MTERIAYVRAGVRHGDVDICTLRSPLPEGLAKFGKPLFQLGDDVLIIRIATRNDRFASAWVALDWLREQGWAVSPDVPQFQHDEIGYITTDSLRHRGWTPKVIETFLPHPAREKLNPRYSSAAPMRLYARARVAALERCPEGVDAMAKAKERRRRSKTT